LKYAFLDFDRQKYAESFIKKFYSCRRLVTSSLSEAKYSFSGIIFDYKNLISLKWNCHLAEEILKKLNNLPKLVSESRKKNDLYVSELKGSPLVPLNFSKYSVPWRSVFRLPGIDWRQQFDISESVRKEGVDISNWYIPSHWMMDGLNSRNLDLRETEQLSREVFQFWVDETANEVSIKHAASIMKKTLGC